MIEDIPPQVVKDTQISLGKYIKEPPLTEKLLKKPPFRFLQDIVKSVIKETGFLGDVYTAEELSENIKEKDKKVAFLKKLITSTQDATGTTVSARPSKIVAGLEVIKTLQLLQAVAAGVALKQSGAIIEPPVIEEKKDKKKSKDSEKLKKSKSKKEGDEKKEGSAKEKKRKKSEDGKNDKAAIETNGEIKRDKSGREGSEGKKKRDKSAKEGIEEGERRDKSARDVAEEERKRDKSAKDGSEEAKKSDKAPREGNEEKRKRDKSAKEGGSEKKKRDKSAKEGSEEGKKRDKSAREINGEDKKRDKSGKQDKLKERPPSRRPSLDGLEESQTAAVLQDGVVNGELIVDSPAPNGVPLVNGDALINGTAPSNVLEESKENTEPQVSSGLRKSSIDMGKEKLDKENREKPEKSEKKDRSKEGSTSERKTSSRRSSSKVRPSSKNAEKTDKPIKEKKAEEEPAVLGIGDVAPIAPKPERPQTARKAPPSARPQSMRPPSARPGAPKIRDRGEVKTDLNETETEVKAVTVITDSDQLQDDENTVTVERQALSPDFDTHGSNFLDMVNKVGENEGALVAQILETKKELEETGQIIGGDSTQRNIEIEWEGGRKQKKEAWGKEINKLREGIQQLTRSTNPLGKLFDFLQEDVDSMQRELKTWKETNASYTKQLENERRLTESSLETYRRQLAELDSLIDQETETLKNMKANVLANDRKIYSLLTKTSTEF